MGYRVPRRELELTFEGTDFDGAVIRCRLDISLETLFEFERIAGADVESARAVYEKFADEVLVSWNLEQDDGTPVPASAAGLMAQPPVFCHPHLDIFAACAHYATAMEFY